MMACLFFIYALCLWLIWLQKKTAAFCLILFNLLLCLLMLIHHSTDIIKNLFEGGI